MWANKYNETTKVTKQQDDTGQYQHQQWQWQWQHVGGHAA